MSKAARPGRIYVDYLRNRRAATTIAAYSTRARAGAPISVPLAWEELSPRLPSDHYTVASVTKRLTGLRADPWASYWTLRQRLPAGGVADDATA
jgi:bifunctional non-homologous end joining protein LigD